MFTVCPKCALTLVVTAADLRVAQGYVRCGRCSSVFNALAQLSEERQAAGAAAEPTPRPPPEEPTSPATETTAPAEAPEQAAAPAPPPPPAQEQPGSPPPDTPDDDAVPEEALEFNPEKTDVASVFVKPPPNPQWTAATGSFKSLVAANQEGATPAANSPAPAASSPAPAARQVSEPAKPPPPAPATPAAHAPERSPESDDEQFDVELDAQLLADIVLGDGGTSRPAGGGPPAPPAEPLAPPVEPVAAERAPAPVPPSAPPPQAPPAAPSPSHRPQHVRPAAGASPAPRHPAHPPSPPSPPERAAAHPHPRPEAPAEAAVARLHPAVPLEPGDLRVALAWGIGAALLVFLLAAQVLNHHRDTLATDPRYSRPLSRLYATLGVPLAPRWDLHAYDVRQLGAAADAGSVGRITVRASVHNAATRPQPLPLLRVTLQDRFGNRIASRDVQPREYLRRMPPDALMSVDERVDAQMTFVDPGTNAVGFELDACLPVSGGGITCANDASVR